MPFGSMKQYFQDRGGPETTHGDYLHWPGTVDGFPFRGQPPPMRQEEFENVPLVMDYHTQRFRLWIPAEEQAYVDIMVRIANGKYMQHSLRESWIQEHQDWLIRLAWVQIYGESHQNGTTRDPNQADVYQSAPPTGLFAPQQLPGETGHTDDRTTDEWF